MYSVRPHSSQNPDMELPTTMYSVQPVIGKTNVSQSTNESVIKDIEKRQDILLDKIEYLCNQLNLYHIKKSSDISVPVREELVIHLSAKQPSKNILNVIEQFRNQLSIRTYRHSSVKDSSFKSPIENSSSTTNQSLAVIWADDDNANLPYMFHSHMKITDEQAIVNTLSHYLTNKN